MKEWLSFIIFVLMLLLVIIEFIGLMFDNPFITLIAFAILAYLFIKNR